MTKQKMIETIQETERELDRELTKILNIAGADSLEYQLALAGWAAIYRLTKKLKIPT